LSIPVWCYLLRKMIRQEDQILLYAVVWINNIEPKIIKERSIVFIAVYIHPESWPIELQSMVA
jgi:hypothetical protein